MSVENYLATVIPSDQPFVRSNFTTQWRLDILLPILYKFASLIENVSWAHTRSQIIQEILLPLARKATYSSNWVMRFYAAETFGMIFEKEDEELILKLISDDVRLVYLSAVTAAIRYGSDIAINRLITRMAQEPRMMQTTYLPSFDNVPSITQPIIARRLENSQDINTRIVCYRILLKYPPIKLPFDIKQDLHADDMALRIMTIRYIVYVGDPNILNMLIELLNDPQWEVRAVCIQSLAILQAYPAIPAIILHLDDPEWWVRLVAIQALDKLGPEAKAALAVRGIVAEPMLVNITQYVLNSL